MLETLNSIDTSLFRFVNTSICNFLFDAVMPFITDLNKQPAVLALAIALILWAMFRGGQRLRLAVITLIITIIISDQLASSVIKYWFERPRPCHILNNVRLLVSCGSGFSFPSSHAVNHFAGAFILTFFYPKLKWWLFGFAAAVAFSRVYVGVHYPSDIIGGSVIGMMIGGIVLMIVVQFEKCSGILIKYKFKKNNESS